IHFHRRVKVGRLIFYASRRRSDRARVLQSAAVPLGHPRHREGSTMSRLAHHFATMAYNNAWSNHRLLGSVSRLTEAEFVAPRTSFFPSLKATLNHNVTVDWYYVDALERGLRDQPVNADALRFFEPEEPFATCAPLSVAQHAVDRRLVGLCVPLTD